MKCFLILMLISWAYIVHAMNNDEKTATGDIVINIQDVINGTDSQRYPKGKVNILDDDIKYQCNTLEDVQRLLQDNLDLSYEITVDYIKKFINVEPSVFVQYYIQEHPFSEDNKNIIEKSLLEVINKMQNENNDQYIQNVLLLLQKCSVPSTSTLSFNNTKTVRGKKYLEDDPVKPLSLAIPALDKLLAEDLAKKSSESEKKIRSAEKRERIYQFSLGLMTLIAAVVPSVLTYVDSGSSTSIVQMPCNCSALF